MASSPFHVSMLLCDYAEELNGKLYIMGGGWSRLTRFMPVANMALAIKVEVPWDRANIQHNIKALLVNEDGEPVSLGDPPQQIQVEGGLEVGRPPGLRAGTPIDATLALRFNGLPLEVGVYEWRFQIDNRDQASVRFEVIPAG